MRVGVRRAARRARAPFIGARVRSRDRRRGTRRSTSCHAADAVRQPASMPPSRRRAGRAVPELRAARNAPLGGSSRDPGPTGSGSIVRGQPPIGLTLPCHREGLASQSHCHCRPCLSYPGLVPRDRVHTRWWRAVRGRRMTPSHRVSYSASLPRSVKNNPSRRVPTPCARARRCGSRVRRSLLHR